MYFTLLFPNGEGPTHIYELVFHPCPVWMKGDKQIVVPNPSTPNYEKGHLNILFEKEKSLNLSGTKVGLVCHDVGHGTKEDLETLLDDLRSEGFDVEEYKS